MTQVSLLSRRIGEQARRLNGIFTVVALVFAAGAFTAGCSRQSSTTSASSSAASSSSAMPLAENVPGDGTIIGQVTIVGTPKPAPMPDAGSAAPGAPAPKGMADESLVIGKDGALQNVVVYVDGAPMSDGRNEPAASLDQSGSQYKPHVTAVQIGQPLVVSSHDPYAHDVDMMCVANPPKNMSFPGPGSQTVVFGSPEFFQVRCDIHSFMKAWIAVMPNPYFSVTAKDGTFVIHHVPAGSFTLDAWQERLGKLHQHFHIKAGETVHLNVVYKP